MKKTLKFFWFKYKYYFAKIKSIIKNNTEIMNNYYRQCGVKIGKNCLICTLFHLCRDNCLLEIKDDVIISTDVMFVLHDFSASRVVKGISNMYGKITIGNNSFIGARSVIMYGVELGENTIVAAGSVVVKSFKEGNVLIGGNPAKVIGTWDNFRSKVELYGNNIVDVEELMEQHPELLIRK